jgi:hypothetical protein
MQWITPEREYLVEGEKCSLPDGLAIAGHTNYSPLHPSKFYLVDEYGEVKYVYSEPQEYGIDIELGVTDIHVVVGDTLLVYHWKEFWAQYRPPDELSSRVLIAGLRPIARDELPFDLHRVIAAYEKR